MKAIGLWYGGVSYSAPTVPDDLEEFDSIRDAKNTLYRRSENDWTPATPCVDSEATEIHLFLGITLEQAKRDTQFQCDPYPDRIIRFGPRGGILVERC